MKFQKIELKDIVLILLGLLLGALFTPLSNKISELTINLFKSISVVFSNYYYSSLATHEPDAMSYSIITYIYIIITAGYACFYIYLSGKLQVIRVKISGVRKQIEPKKLDTNNENRDFKKELISIEEDYNKIRKYYKKILIVFGVYLLVLFINTSFVNTVTGVYNKFYRQITIIAPYTDNQELLKLKSDWSRMKTRKDFDIIQAKIESITKANNISD